MNSAKVKVSILPTQTYRKMGNMRGENNSGIPLDHSVIRNGNLSNLGNPK